VQDIPSLPPGGLGILAFSASFSLLGMLVAFLVLLIKKRWVESIWAFSPLLLLSLTMFFGHSAPTLHAGISVLSFALMLRNALFFEGMARWASFIASACCANAILIAIWLF